MRPDISADFMTAFDAFDAELGRLVELFGRNLALHRSRSYSDARLRMDFLDLFFLAIGWDVENML